MTARNIRKSPKRTVQLRIIRNRSISGNIFFGNMPKLPKIPYEAYLTIIYYPAYDIPIIMDRGSNRRLSHGSNRISLWTDRHLEPPQCDCTYKLYVGVYIYVFLLKESKQYACVSSAYNWKYTFI